jgi:hypothetical protein
MDIRRRNYRSTFNTPQGKQVLADLKKVCMGNGTPFSKDPYETALRCGRQEIFMRIITFINMKDDEIASLKENNDV